MKQALRRHLPLIIAAIFVICLLEGCKLRDSSAIAQPTATNLTIEITLQKANYGVNEPVGVVIKNNGKSDVYALDGQASCTILQLQQFDAQKHDWVRIDTCQDNTPAHTLAIHAGMSEPFTLAPGSTADPNSWATGSYRIALSFSAKPDGVSSAQVAYSQGFTITSS